MTKRVQARGCTRGVWCLGLLLCWPAARAGAQQAPVAEGTPPVSEARTSDPTPESVQAKPPAPKREEVQPRPQARADELAAEPPPPADKELGDGELEPAQALWAELQRATEEMVELRERVAEAQGEERELHLPQLEETRTRYRRQLVDAAQQLGSEDAGLKADGETAAALGALVRKSLAEETRRARRELDANQKALLETVSKLEEASDEEQQALREARDAALTRAIILVGEAHALIDASDLLGEDVTAATTWLKTRLEDGATLVGSALQGVAKALETAKATEEGPERQVRVERLEGVRSLMAELQRKQLDLMDEVGLDTVPLRQGLIRATGEVSGDILDAEVAKGLIAGWKDDALAWLKEHGSTLAFKLVTFLLIMLVFWLLARASRWLVRRALARSTQISSLANAFVVKGTGRVVLAVGFVIAAAQVGVQVGPLLAGLGIAGFVLGFALQDTLSNFAAGLMILMYRPFDVGDVVEAGGVMGSVKAMNLVTTAIVTFDNQMLVVPNGKIWGDVIRNVTHQETRRVDLTFGIGYADDIDHAEKVLKGIVAENPRVLEEPAAVVRLHELGDSSVNFIVRPWVKTSEYWDAYWEITREVKRRFDAEGISIPFPQRDVHIYEERLASRQATESDVVPAPTRHVDTGDSAHTDDTAESA